MIGSPVLPQGSAVAVNPFEDRLDKNPANYVALTPLSFLPRSAEVFPEKIALIHGGLRQSAMRALA